MTDWISRPTWTLAAARRRSQPARSRSSHFGAGRRSWYKGPGQVVTEADLEVDALLHDMLSGARPDDGWLSEERVDDGSRHTLRRGSGWSIRSTARGRSPTGVPQFAISVALVERGEPLLGVVLNPATASASRPAAAAAHG